MIGVAALRAQRIREARSASTRLRRVAERSGVPYEMDVTTTIPFCAM